MGLGCIAAMALIKVKVLSATTSMIAVTHTPTGYKLWMQACRLMAIAFT